jgi:SAV_6107-like HEPN
MTTATLSPPAPPRTLPSALPASAARLLAGARRALVEARTSSDALERYAFAHLAALRAAAALLAHRARPGTGRSRRPTSVWTLLVSVAPELQPWAMYFAAGANKRIAAESGMRGAVTTREADDLVRDSEAFVAVIDTALGMLAMPTA